jgi:hypothetical protein
MAESEALQDKELAEKGVYQPYDQATLNKARLDAAAEEEDEDLADHRKNLAFLPAVSSQHSGAASQAK